MVLGKKNRKRERQKRPRWKGLLANADRMLRIMIFVLLLVISVSLTFTELGFVGIKVGGHYLTYAVIVLYPVSLAALLFGAGLGSLMGLLSGAILYLHSIVMPLNSYEMTFVTPFTSIIVLTIVGFLLGRLFGRALRNDPPLPKRVLYIALVCLLVSAFYSINFMLGAIGALVKYALTLADTVGDEEQLVAFVQQDAVSLALRMGSIRAQILVDALLMMAFSVFGDYVARWAIRIRDNVNLHTIFNAWLSAVVLLVFMLTTALGFVSITHGERQEAYDDMQSEVKYLCNQLADSDRKSDSMARFIESIGLDIVTMSDEDTRTLVESFSIENLLDGYTRDEDGLVLVLYNMSLTHEAENGASEAEGNETDESDGFYFNPETWKVSLADREGFDSFSNIRECLDHTIIQAIGEGLYTGEPQRVIYDDNIGTMTDLGSALGKTVNAEVAFLCAQSVNDYAVVMIRPASMVFADRRAAITWTALTSFVLLLAVYAMVSRLLGRVVVRHINDTNNVLARITEGDLEARVEVQDSAEFRSLSEGINETVDTLKGWIAEAETRMDSELATAKAIQEAALPRIFPPFPDIMSFDIYASMHPAKEVGGDFYDFFLVGDEPGADKNKLGFVIADVSGKGIPAALFMMAAKTQIHDYMASGMELGEAIENANHQLCDNNDAGMFVTVFAGILDYTTGHVVFVNAGHNPPLLWQGGSWNWMRKRSGLPLGLFDGMPYKAYEVDCLPGDQFLLYTDGVTEAMDVSDQQYGEKRLEELTEGNFDLHPRMLVNTVRESVAEFTVGAEQSDDITILALEVGVPPELTATLEVPAKLEELENVNAFIHSELDRRLCPLRAQNQIDIAVEELFVNVVSYAYAGIPDRRENTLRVSYTYTTDPPSIKIDFVDEGVAFNPLAKPDASTPSDIMDVPIGGLGILMAKKSVDEMTYERVDDTNVVSIVKRW